MSKQFASALPFIQLPTSVPLGDAQDHADLRALRTPATSDKTAPVLYEVGTEGAWEHNLQTGTAFYSPAFAALLGYLPGELRSQVSMWDHLVHPNDLTCTQILFGIAMERQRRAQGQGENLVGPPPVFDFTVRMQHRDGSWRRMRCRGTVGTPWRTLIGSITPVRGLQASDLEAPIPQLIETLQDPLTQLPTRQQLEVRLNQSLALSRRLLYPVTVLMFDIDHFSSINAHFGREGGDQVLVEIANRLSGLLREVDIVARDGANRFVAVLNGSNLDNSKRVCRRLINMITEGIWLGNGEMCWVRATVGAATTPGDGCDARSMLKQAENSLRHARMRGVDGIDRLTAEAQARTT